MWGRWGFRKTRHVAGANWLTKFMQIRCVELCSKTYLVPDRIRGCFACFGLGLSDELPIMIDLKCAVQVWNANGRQGVTTGRISVRNWAIYGSIFHETQRIFSVNVSTPRDTWTLTAPASTEFCWSLSGERCLRRQGTLLLSEVACLETPYLLYLNLSLFEPSPFAHPLPPSQGS